MEFEYSERTKKLKAEIEEFMDAHVFPNEATYYQQLEEGDTRWKPVPILEELKAKAKSAGLWNLFLPESERGAGLTNLEYAPLVREHGPRQLGARGLQLLRPRHRQHGDDRTLRHRRAEA